MCSRPARIPVREYKRSEVRSTPAIGCAENVKSEAKANDRRSVYQEANSTNRDRHTEATRARSEGLKRTAQQVRVRVPQHRKEADGHPTRFDSDSGAVRFKQLGNKKRNTDKNTNNPQGEQAEVGSP